MKTVIKSILILCTVGLFLSACDLERDPYNAINTERAFETMEDARFHRNGLLSQLRSRQHGVFVHTAEWMTDLFIATPDFGNRGGSPHRLNELLIDTHEPRDIWRNTYSSIAQVNNFIARINQVELTSATDSALIANWIAEAHYIRAYMYYILIKYFGVAYDPATANSKPGVPLITVYDPAYRPARASVGEIYHFIMSEIALAENLTVSGPTTDAQRETITIDAVKALKSRVQLMMSDYAGAAATAMELINSGRHPLIATEAGLRNNWAQDTGSEDIFRMFVSAVEFGVALGGTGNPANAEQNMAPFMNWIPGNRAHSPDWLPSQRAMDLYEAGDFRRTAFFHFGTTTPFDDSTPTNSSVFVNSIRSTNVYMLNKWPFSGMYGGNHRHKPKVHRIAEQYLIAAESLAGLGNTSEALAVLNTLRTARGASAFPAWDDQELRNEWAREMIGEGVYLAHMKRWSIGFDRRVPQMPTRADGNPAGAVPRAYVADWALDVFVPGGCFRLTLPIPMNELNLNPNIQQTPEWINPQIPQRP